MARREKKEAVRRAKWRADATFSTAHGRGVATEQDGDGDGATAKPARGPATWYVATKSAVKDTDAVTIWRPQRPAAADEVAFAR